MQRIAIKKLLPAVAAAVVLSISSCSLDPEIKAPNEIPPPQTDGTSTPPSLNAVYEQLNSLTGGQGNWFGMQEHSTDEVMGPTRGTDWDDFGTWRRLHLHTWGPDHNQVNDTWGQINGALFQTTLLAELSTNPSTRAQGRFLRSFFRWLSADLYGVVQSRPATAPNRDIPAVLTRAVAIDTIITELESAVPDLAAFTRANRRTATKEAAWALLAKLYLNKAVYKADPSKPEGPYTFAAADMNKVIEYCDRIIANSNLTIDDNYWDNFKWDNGTASTENIFVRHNNSDPVAGNGAGLRWQTSQSFHYNQAPSSWNGFVTLSEFYDKFSASDVRRGADIPVYTARTGNPAGFIVGQAFGPVKPGDPKAPGVVGDPIGPLFDRAGNPLIFTRTASIFFNGEASGIRINKFPLDPSTINDGAWGSNNEFPFFRLSDVYLMKAEAILRGGAPTGGQTAVQLVNAVRSRRGVADLTSVNLTQLLDERGRELYMEGHRRTDMVRFGVFNRPVEERPTQSEGYKVVYPIPIRALSSNPNLKQNFGY